MSNQMHLVKLRLPNPAITINDFKSQYNLPDGSIDERFGLLKVNKILLAAKMTLQAFTILVNAGVDVKLQSNPTISTFEPL